MSDIKMSFNNVSNNFMTELKKASSDKKITNNEIKELLNKVETQDDMEIVKSFTDFDKKKVNLNIKSGSSEENFKLDIAENNLKTDDNDNIEEKVSTSTGKNIIIKYAKDESTIPSSKQIKGTVQEANDKINSILPDNKKAEWSKLNKHNVNDVKSFINNLNLPMDKKAEFVAAYLTANYNHPGIDISWEGSNLQEGINAVPKDKEGRKYLDCEAYAKLATELLGGSSKDYGVHAPSPYDSSGGRNHQVSVVREGNNAYVISNNEITKISDPGNKSDSDLIKSVYSDFDNIKEDKSGAMRSGVDEYDVGQKITTSDGREIEITSIDENSNKMKGKIGEQDVIITVKPEGGFKFRNENKVGDTLTTNDGLNITLTEKVNDNTFKGQAMINGQLRTGTVRFNEDGTWTTN